MMDIDFPFHISGRGRTATTGDAGQLPDGTGAAAHAEDEHIRDLIEQLLFTSPGERVNRPDFGTGLMRLVFAPAGDETAAAIQFLVQGALQQWLGDRIQVEAARVESEDSTLRVTVQYVVRRSGERQTVQFRREV